MKNISTGGILTKPKSPKRRYNQDVYGTPPEDASTAAHVQDALESDMVPCCDNNGHNDNYEKGVHLDMRNMSLIRQRTTQDEEE